MGGSLSSICGPMDVGVVQVDSAIQSSDGPIFLSLFLPFPVADEPCRRRSRSPAPFFWSDAMSFCFSLGRWWLRQCMVSPAMLRMVGGTGNGVLGPRWGRQELVVGRCLLRLASGGCVELSPPPWKFVTFQQRCEFACSPWSSRCFELRIHCCRNCFGTKNPVLRC